MNLTKKTSIWLVATTFLASGAYAETNILKKKNKNTKTPVVQPILELEKKSMTNQEKPNLFAMTPDLPDQIEFCGEVIDLRETNMRERFDREMMAVMYMHSSTLLMIKRANRYFPVLETILKNNQLPDDMKYLACIESNLDSRALSPSGAIGMWQFMPETARDYGLEVNEEIDERYDYVKETEAACRYLKNSYQKYGDWASAAASYNIGTARITKELARQRETTSMNLWLVEQTSRYVFRILACKEFMSNPQKYGFFLKKEQLYTPIVSKDTLVTGKVANWIDFAVGQGISFYDLKNYNSWIRSDSLINEKNKPYKVAIPQKESLYYEKKNITVHQKNWVIDED